VRPAHRHAARRRRPAPGADRATLSRRGTRRSGRLGAHVHRPGQRPPCLRRQRLPRAQPATRRNGLLHLPAQHRLAPQDTPLRRRLRRGSVRAQPADRLRQARHRGAAHLVGADRHRRDGDLRPDDARPPDLGVPADRVPALRPGAHLTDMDHRRGPSHRPGLRRGRRPRGPSRGRRTAARDAPLGTAPRVSPTASTAAGRGGSQPPRTRRRRR
jgi:hypothetical protein